MAAESEREKERCFCPFCEEEIKAADFPWCRACGVIIVYCPKCQEPVSQDKRVCPHCGAEIKD